MSAICYDYDMKTKVAAFNNRQLLFKELFVGTLIYAVVLAFFGDYTDIVQATSFSMIFLAAIVLEVLTCGVMALKKHIVQWLKDKSGIFYRFCMFFCVWLVMFSSKLVFIWVIDFIFGEHMNIHGFFGVLWLVLSVTILHKLADRVFLLLGDK